MALHDWNEQIGAAFYRPLQKAELALQVRVNDAFTTAYGDQWFQNPRFIRESTFADRKSIAEAINRLMKEGTDIDADAMMAKSSFGLCVGLLRPNFNPQVWSIQLRTIFPLLPHNQDRHAFAKLASRAASLRNRIDHHEPLIELDLSFQHSSLLKLLDWIDAGLAAKARADRTVPLLLRAKP